MPFKNLSNVKVIGDEIYVIENFLSPEECETILNVLKNVPSDEWTTRDPYPVPTVSPSCHEEAELIIDKLREVVLDEYRVNETRCFNWLKTGDKWGEHADNAEFEEIRKKSELLKDGDPFELTDNTAYGVVFYINDDYTGGELYYVHQGLSYKPKAGDMVIHSSEEKCKHGVRAVREGNRYNWSSHLGITIKVPVEH